MYNDVITNGRSGKGVVIVKSAGNRYSEDREECNRPKAIGTSCSLAGDDRLETLPIISVAAVNALGKKSSYSSAGAIWVSGFGGEYGYSSDRLKHDGGKYLYSYDYRGKPAMITTDVTTCGSGYSSSNSYSINDFDYSYPKLTPPEGSDEDKYVILNVTSQNVVTIDPAKPAMVTKIAKPHSDNPTCDYTSTFTGTSSASPIVSGVVALLLSQNPSLTIWDVRYILAKTATKIDSNYTVIKTIPSLGSYHFNKGWITNAAGFNYSNWYGFGLVNVDVALAMAKTYFNLITHAKIKSVTKKSQTLNSMVPNKNITGVSDTLKISNENGKVDHLNLFVDLVAPGGMQDIEIELTSPSGTVYYAYPAGTGHASYRGLTYKQRLAVNAFLGENINGDWKITIKDLYNNGDFGVNDDYADNEDDTFIKWKLEIKYHEDTNFL